LTTRAHIERILELAYLARQADAELDKRHGSDRKHLVSMSDEKMARIAKDPNVPDQQLEQYLNNMPLESLQRVHALMYSGRDIVDARLYREQFKNETREQLIHPIMEKRSNLAMYLRGGLKQAGKDHLDLGKF
jgi:hypothetical protein